MENALSLLDGPIKKLLKLFQDEEQIEQLLANKYILQLPQQEDLHDFNNLNIQQSQTFILSNDSSYLNESNREVEQILESDQSRLSTENNNESIKKLSNNLAQIGTDIQKLNKDILQINDKYQLFKLLFMKNEKFIEGKKNIEELRAFFINGQCNKKQYFQIYHQSKLTTTFQKNEFPLQSLNDLNEDMIEYVDPLPFDVEEQEQFLDFGLEIQCEDFIDKLLAPSIDKLLRPYIYNSQDCPNVRNNYENLNEQLNQQISQNFEPPTLTNSQLETQQQRTI